MKKRIYMTKEELRETEIRLSNDYIGEIESTRWIGYLDKYEVTIRFDSKEELNQFCEMYGYRMSWIGKGQILYKKEES